MLKLKQTLLRTPSFIFHFGRRTYKIFTPVGSSFRKVEILGNGNALQNEFWQDQVVAVTPKPCSLAMARGIPLRQSQYELAANLVETKLERAITYPLNSASAAYDFKSLKQLENYGLSTGLLDRAEAVLRTVPLPVTSAHGDLHLGNMIRIGHEIRIIDWSMFSNAGSFVTDYIHFYNYRHAEKAKISWTQSIVQEHAYLHTLGQRLALHPDQLRLAYALSRISGATSQWPHLKQVPYLEITKYNFVLNQILKALTTDAVV